MYWMFEGIKSEYSLPENVFSIIRRLVHHIKKISLDKSSHFIIDCNNYIHKTSDKQIRILFMHGFRYSIHFFFSVHWRKDYMVVTSVYWVRKCFYFFICFFSYHVFNLLYFSNAAAKPFLYILGGYYFFLLFLLLAFCSPILFLTNHFFPL